MFQLIGEWLEWYTVAHISDLLRYRLSVINWQYWALKGKKLQMQINMWCLVFHTAAVLGLIFLTWNTAESFPRTNTYTYHQHLRMALCWLTLPVYFLFLHVCLCRIQEYSYTDLLWPYLAFIKLMDILVATWLTLMLHAHTYTHVFL